ncbi:unnamed protein product [Somion occarium]|uniref:Transmembrane protein n=1 Tax=Somion occarium TaxID=3059160 RepID=A0ABP1EA04_9APHY
MQRVSVLSGLVFALASFIPGAFAQGTNATCETGFDWMVNSRGQSPCLVAAYLNTPCIRDPSDAYVFALPPGFHYRPPIPSTATECQCSSVFYSVLQACAICQGDPSVPWSTWNMNCTSAVYQSVYPHDIPVGTSIPAWAYLDVSLPDNFNLTGAQALADTHPPESTAVGAPTSVVSVSPTASGSASGSGAPNVTPSVGSSNGSASTSGGGTNVGAIVGGVIGGVIGLALIVGAVWWFMRRRRHTKAHAPASSQFDISGQQPITPFNEKQQQPLLSSPVPQMGMSPPPFAPQPVPTPPPTAGKIYNPNDPSTFPGASPETSLSPTAYSQPAYGYPQNVANVGYTQAPGRYSGVPEL